MPRRCEFHVTLSDLLDEAGRRQMSARDQAQSLQADGDWSDLYLEGRYIGRMQTVGVEGERVNMVAELRDDHQLPPLMQLGRFRATADGAHSALLEKFTIMVRPEIDREERS